MEQGTAGAIVGLDGRFTATRGRHFLTGIGALARLPLQQIRLDRAAGLRTRAFVSGYPGSPLGGLDLELARRRSLLDEYGVVHQPGLNEELAATAVFGSQVATVTEGFDGDGVLGLWHGKAPGLDRAADAIRHGNWAGTGPASGVLVLVGDDPAGKSSTLPSASEGLCADLGLPVLHPGDPQDILDLGRHAVALSRASGLWVAMKVVTAVADGTVTADLDPERVRPRQVPGGGTHRVVAKLHQPFTGELERDLHERRLPLASAYGALNGLNTTTLAGEKPWLGVVATGHTYPDLLEAFRVLGVRPEEVGVRLYRVRMPFPMAPAGVRAFAAGLDQVLVVEEKRDLVERQVRDALYGVAGTPEVAGKRDGSVPGWGALDADRIAPVLRARLLDRVDPARLRPERTRRVELPLVAARTPWFCSGCPHSTSTRVPDGALVGTGIGCHALASRMDPRRTGTVLSNTQMGGEGSQWVGASPFLPTEHIFQNLGDGTLAHSGWLGIRFAVAARSRITFKILYNGAVSMTGGQDALGIRSIPELVRGLKAEGVGRVIVTTEDVRRYRRTRLPAQVWDRSRILQAQQVLAAEPGVTALIHDQACAAELRRHRKRGTLPNPAEQVVINSRVCEGCGDCGAKSACLSLHPVATDHGPKTAVHQGSCNVDLSCLDGDCPSFMLVAARRGGGRRAVSDATAVAGTVSAGTAPTVTAPGGTGPDIAEPVRRAGAECAVRLVGVGGTGVVTTAQILGMAAALEGLEVSGLDQTGLSQKAGPVVSDLRIGGPGPGRASRRGVDLVLAFDLLTAAGPEHAAVFTEHTVLVANTAATPTGAMIGGSDPGAVDPRAFPGEVIALDAHATAVRLIGDPAASNTVLLGVAYQHGLLPCGAGSVEEAIRQNGVAVAANIAAFRAGRRHAVDGDAGPAEQPSADAETGRDEPRAVENLDERIARRAADLAGYQDRRYADRYLAAVRRARATGSEAFTRAVADNLHKLMAYKDEYEVARLHLAEAARLEADAAVGGPARVTLLLHPPVLRALGVRRKLRFGSWSRPVLRLLRAGWRLRGTPLDPFGHARVRRVERDLREEYLAVLDRLVTEFPGEAAAVRIAELPQQVRGYEEIKLASVERYRAALRRELDAIE
jgi:indolepyruvate ferredoxin oxidoreductase